MGDSVKPRLLDYSPAKKHGEAVENRKTSMKVQMNGITHYTLAEKRTERLHSSGLCHSSGHSSTKNRGREVSAEQNPFSNPIHACIGNKKRCVLFQRGN